MLRIRSLVWSQAPPHLTPEIQLELGGGAQRERRGTPVLNTCSEIIRRLKPDSVRKSPYFGTCRV